MTLFRPAYSSTRQTLLPVVEPLEGRQLLAASASISGRIYVDQSGDGKQRGKLEAGVEGSTVYLDLNDNDALDSTDTTTLTDRKGNFKFKKLDKGIYHLREVLPSGFVAITPPGGEWFIDLRQKKTAAKKNFGHWPLSQGTPPIPDKDVVTPNDELPTPIVFYNTGASNGNNPDGTNTAALLTGGASATPNPYWSVRSPALRDVNGVALGDDENQPFSKTYFSFDPTRYNADLQPASGQSDSTFIGPDPQGLTNSPAGKYVFSTAFDLTGYEATTMELTGAAIGDDKIVDIRLNGQSVGLSSAVGAVLPFSLRSGFVPGVNTLQFVVENTTASPVALRVDALRGAARKIKPGATTLFNTGVGSQNTSTGSNGTRLSLGAVEGHWSVSTPGSGYAFYTSDSARRFVYNNALTSGLFGAAFIASDRIEWANEDLNPGTPGVDSAFINPTGRANDILPAGTYIYRTTFDLTGIDANTASITGTLLAAGAVQNIYINGNATGQGIGAGFEAKDKKTFSINAGLVSGLNVLDIVLTNSVAGPSGIRVDDLRGISTAGAVRSNFAYPLRLPLPSFPPLTAPTTSLTGT